MTVNVCTKGTTKPIKSIPGLGSSKDAELIPFREVGTVSLGSSSEFQEALLET